MKALLITALFFGLLISAPFASAQTLYWDINGSSAGASDGTTAAGVWDEGVTQNWNASSNGLGSSVAWISGSNAIFSAGSNATGSYRASMGLGVHVPTITVEEGTVEFYGGSIYDLHTVNVASGSEATINSSLRESGSTINFTKSGGGLLTLLTDGINLDHSGTTTVSGGTFRIGDYTQIGPGDVSVSNGATLDTFYSIDINGRTVAVTGAGSTHSTTGHVDIGDASSATVNLTAGGAFTATQSIELGLVNGITGTVNVDGAGSLLSADGTLTLAYGGIGNLTVANGGRAEVGTILYFGYQSTGVGTLNLNTGGTLAVGGTNGIVKGAGTAHFNLGGGTIEVTGSNLTTSVPANLVSGTTSTIDTNGFNATLNGALSGDGGIAKSGTGNLTLGSANTHSGGSTVNAGTLTLGTATSLGASTGDVTLNGGTLDLGGFNPTVGTAIFNGGTFTNGNLNNSTAFEVQTGSLNTALGGSGSLTKTGSGSFTLSTTHTYTGGTTVSAGTLNLGHATDTLADAGSVTVDGGTLALGANSDTVGAVSLHSGNITGSGTLTATGFTLTDTGSISANLAGSGTLTKSGGGTVTLSGTNTFTGATTINAGTLSIGADTALGTAPVSATPGHLTVDGGTLATTASFTLDANRGVALGESGGTIDTAASTTLTYGGAIAGTGALTKSGTGTLSLTGTNTFNGGTTVSAGTLSGTTSSLPGNIVNNSVVVFDQSTDGTYSGDMSGTGALTKNGSGTVALTGTNSYSGTTTVSAGNLRFGSTDALYNADDSQWTKLTVASGAGIGIDASHASFDSDAIITLLDSTTFSSGTPALDVYLPTNHVFTQSLDLTGVTTAQAEFTLSGSGFLRPNGNTLSLGGDDTQTFSVERSFVAGYNGGDGGNASSHYYRGGDGGAGYSAGAINLALGNTTFSQTIALTGGQGGHGGNGAQPHTSTNGSGGGGGGNGGQGGVVTITGGNSLFTQAIDLSGGDGGNGGNGGAGLNYGIGGSGGSGGAGGKGGSFTIAGGDVQIAEAVSLDLSGGTGGTGGTGGNNGHLSGYSGRWYSGSSGAAGTLGTLTLSSGSLELPSIGWLGNAATFTGNFAFTGGTLRATDATETLSLDGSSVLGAALANASVTDARTLDLAGDLTYSGVIAGSGSLAKAGSGSLTLSGANTFSGETTISAGSLVLGHADALQNSTLTTASGLSFGGLVAATFGGLSGTNDLALTNGSAVAVDLTVGNNNASTLYSGALSGAGSLTKIGTGNLTLTGANNYSGNTTVSAGTLTGNTTSLSGDITNNAAVVFDQTSTGTYAGTMTGSGAFTKSGAGILTLSGPNDYSGGTTVSAGTLTGNTTSLQGNIVNNAAVVFDQASSGTYTGDMSGTGSLNKSGAGNLTLSGTNSYAGSTTVTAGSLAITTAANLGTGDIALTNGGDLSVASGFETTTDLAITIDGTGSTFSSSGHLWLNRAGGTTNSINITNGGTLVTGTTLSLADVGSTSVGTLSVSGTNSSVDSTGKIYVGYAGQGSSTVANGGTISTDAQVSLATTAGSQGTFNLNDGGTLSVGGSNGIAFGAGTGSFNANGGTLRVNGSPLTTSVPVTLGADTDTTIDTNNLSASLSGTLSGDGALTKSGTGDLTLSGANSYAGGTTVSAGTLTGNTTSLQGPIVNNAAVIFDQALTASYAGIMSGTGSLTKSGAGNLTLSGTNTYSGGTTVSSGTLSVTSDANLGANSGNLAVTSGATLNTGGYFGTNRDITLDGSGTHLSNNGELIIGSSGTGSLTLTNSATVSAYNLDLGFPSGTGTVNISSGSSITATGNNGVVFYSPTSTINLNETGTLTTTGLSGTGDFNLAGGTLRSGAAYSSSTGGTLTNNSSVDTNGFNTTLSGNLSGTGSLTKTGLGTLTLSGTNTYAGGTTVSAGNLTGNSTSLQGNITNNAAITFDQASTGTYAGDMAGTGTLTKSGTGNLTLSGTNTYAGGTTVSAGNLTGNTTSLLGNITNNAVITFDQASTGTYAGVISGSGALTKAGTGTLTLSGVNSYTGGTTVSAGTLTLGVGTASGSVAGNISNDGTVVFNRNDDYYYNGVISGTGNVTNDGYILRFTEAQTFTGATSVKSGGYLVLANNVDQGLSAATTVDLESGAVLDISNRAQTIAGLTGAGRVYSFVSEGHSAGGHLTVNTASGQEQVFSGVLGGASSANFAFTKAGDGTLTLSGANNYAGATTVNAGTLRLGASGALSDNSAFTVGAAGTLDLNDFSDTIGSLAGAGAVTLGSGHLTTGGDNTNTTFSGVLSGTGALTKSGSGTLTLSGNNTYSGTTSVNAGTLAVTDLANLGTGNIAVSGGANLTASSPLAFDSNRNVSVSGAGSTLGSTGYIWFGTSGGAVTNNITVTNGGTISTGQTLSLADNGASSQSTLTVSGTNSSASSTGNLYVGYAGQGTATVSNGGSISTDATLSIATTAGSNGTFNLNNGGTLQVGGTGGIAIGAGSGTFNANGGTIQVVNVDLTSSAAMNLGVSTTSTVDTNTRNATLSGVLSGSGALTKTGTGTLTLSGANTYTGTTTVSAGTLNIANSSGSAFGTGDVTVQSGASLTGSGSFTGALTLDAGATLAPGNSPGLMTIGDGSEFNGTLNFEIGGLTRGTQYDAINIDGDGNLTFGGILNVTLINDFTPSEGNSFDLFDYTTATGTFDSINLASLSEGFSWDTTALYSTGAISVIASAVPEPSTYAALFGLGALGFAAWRRHRRA